MSRSEPFVLARGCLALLLLSTWAAPAQEPKVAIDALRVGFDGTVKSGCWVPLAVDIVSENFSGGTQLQISTPDSDGNMTSLFVPNIPIEAGQTRTIRHFVKLSQDGAAIELTLHGPSGSLARRTFELAALEDVVFDPPGSILVVGVGRVSGLGEEEGPDPDPDDFQSNVAWISKVEELPRQWFAYEAATSVVLALGDSKALSRMQEDNKEALRSWVRLGGRLVVSVGSDWQTISKSFLAEMLPATLTGIETVGPLDPRIAAIDKIAGDRNPGLKIDAAGVPLVTLVPKGDRPDSKVDQSEVVVTGSYGFGQVTLLGIDVETRPFRQWEGKREFWSTLLDLPSKAVAPSQSSRYGDSRDPFGTWIDRHLESFANVSIVPFSWIALLILGYILLIGPIDYFFLKRAIGKLELTWLTFPFWVGLVCVGAYFAANRLKGNELRINRIEILDVDLDSKTLRGRDFVSAFSPVIDRYSVTTTPGTAAEGTWEELGMGAGPQSRVTSWLGRASYRGFGTPRGGGLLGESSYSFASPEPVAVLNVPIRVWSDKSFTTQWLAKSGPILESTLHVRSIAVDEGQLLGEISNRLPTPIHDVVLLWGKSSYSLDSLSPGQTKSVDRAPRDAFASLPQELEKLQRGMYGSDEGGWEPKRLQEGGSAFARQLTIWSHATASEETRSNALSALSLRPLLDDGKAVLIGRLDVPAGQLWLDNSSQGIPGLTGDPPEIHGVQQRYTILRVVMEPRTDD